MSDYHNPACALVGGFGPCNCVPHIPGPVDPKDARIAELEAQNKRANRDYYVAEEARYDAVKALQQAEAERDALRCCGNCGYIDQWDEDMSCEAGHWVHTMPNGRSFETNSVGCGDPCHFTPSRHELCEGGEG